MENIDETSSITQEDYDKLNTLITNSLLEKVEDVNKLTITNYVDTNNYLPLVITTNENMTNKVITTNTLGIYINEEQKDWHEELTPNSILIWLDLNTIDLTSEYITLQIDGVTYELQLSISINNEESDTNQGELEDDVVEEENGDTEFLPGTMVNVLDFEDVNEQMIRTPAISFIYFTIFSIEVSYPYFLNFFTILSGVLILVLMCSMGLYLCTCLNSSFKISIFVVTSFKAELYKNIKVSQLSTSSLKIKDVSIKTSP